MLRLHQISIANLLFCMALISAMFAFRDQWFVILSIATLLVIVVAGEVLVRCLPSSIITLLTKNCYRMDGSYSGNRASVERRVISKLRRDVQWIWTLLLIPSLFVLWFVDRELFPISLGFHTVASYSVEEDNDWRSHLEHHEEKYLGWIENSNVIKDKASHREFVKDFWPVVAMLGAVWVLGALVALKAGYFSLRKNVVKNARGRRERYSLRDLARTPVRPTEPVTI